MTEILNKIFCQKLCLFIGASLFMAAISFSLIDYSWCQDISLILLLSSLNLISITIFHMIIFGGIL